MTDPLQTLRPHLQPGERVLWSGGPAAVPLARSYQKYSWVGWNLLTIPVLIFLMKYDINDGPGDILKLPARYLIFPAFGVLLINWPRWKGRRASGMAYAITDTRIVIAEGSKARSFRPDTLTVILRRDRDNGRDDLTFGDRPDEIPNQPRGMFTSEYEHRLSHQAGFFGIEDVEGAEAAAFTIKEGQA